MNLHEFKQKYPAYQDVDDEALASALHRKYYSDIPFDKFAANVGLKSGKIKRTKPAEQHPAYQQQTTEKLTASLEANTPKPKKAEPFKTMSPMAGMKPSALGEATQEFMKAGPAMAHGVKTTPERWGGAVAGSVLFQKTGKLRQIETAENIKRQEQQGKLTAGKYPLGAMAQFNVGPYLKLSEQELQDQKAATEQEIQLNLDAWLLAREEIARTRPKVDPDSFAGYAGDTTAAFIDMLPALGIGYATKGRGVGQVLGLATMGFNVFGNKYADVLEQTKDPEKAFESAFMSTLAETGTEVIPLRIMTGSGKLFNRLVGSVFAEGLTEPITDVVEMAADQKILEGDETFGEAMATIWNTPELRSELFDRMQRSAVIGGVLGGAGGGVVATTEAARQSLMPSSRKRSSDSGIPPMTEAKSPTGSPQAAPSQDSMRSEPSGKRTMRDTTPSAFVGPTTTLRDFSIGDTSSNNRIILQGSDNVDQIYQASQIVKPQFDAVLKNVALKTRGGVKPAPLKNRKRVQEKIDEGKSPSEISDYLRGMVTAETPQMLDAQVQELTENYPVIEVDDFRNNPKLGGYRGVHMQLKMPNGVSGEIQVLPAPVAAVKEQAHEIYSKWLNVTEVSPEQAKQREADYQRSEQIMQQAWEQFETPSRQTRGGPAGGMGPVSPSDVTRPSAPREVAGTDLGPFLDKLNSSEDAQELFARVTQMFEGTMEDARRGKVSWEETEKLAEAYLGDTSFLDKRKKGEAFNASQIEASRAIIDQGMQEVLEAAERAATGTDADLVDFQNKLDTFVPLAQQVLGARAEAGRALNILKKQAMQAKQMKSVLETIGGREHVEAKAEALKNLKNNGLPTEQLTQAAAKLQKPTTMDMIIEVWINALLSGPQTHAVNMTSNFLTASFTLPEHMIAGMIGKLHGGNKVYMREALSRIWGMLEGIKDGSLAFGKTLWTEQTTDPMSKLESRRYEAIPGRTGKVVRLPGRFLQAEDEFYKGIGRRMEVKTRALRQALNEKADKPYERARELEREVYDLIGKERPEQMSEEEQIAWDIWDQAFEAARYQTFTNELGPAGKQIQRLVNKVPVPLKFIAPFIRTPTNIVKFAGHRSPFAMTMPSFWRMMREGGAARDVALARMAMGSALASYVMHLAANGFVTGGGPEDPNERRVWMQKYKPYSFYNPKTNEYQSFSRLEPLGMIMGISADFAYVLSDLEDKEAGDIALQLHTSIIKNLTSKTFLRGITDFINMYSDPERYGNWWIQSFAGTAIPTGIAQIARTQDPTLRRTETVLQRLRSRVPYLSKDLLPRLNLWGEPIVLGGGLGPDIISPIYLGTDPHDPVVDEMLRLEYSPGRISRTIGGVELSPQQHNEYIRIAGQRAKQMLHKIVQSPRYQNANDALRESMIKKVFDKTRQAARVHILLNHPDVLGEVKNKRMERAAEYAE